MSKAKKQTQALQLEVTTDEEWDEILTLPGLTLVEIYSEWSGSCPAMIPTLRKIKMSLAGDLLNLIIACNNNINALKRFRGKSEPTWMFIQNGKLINLVFGSNCPQLKRIIVKEMKRYEENEEPLLELAIEQRTPDEEVRYLEQETQRRLLIYQKQFKEEEVIRRKYEQFLLQMMIELSEETALIIFPWVFYDQDGNPIDKEKSPAYLQLIYSVLPDRFDIAEQTRIQLNENMVEKIFLESGIVVTDDLIEVLTEGQCMALRLKGRIPPKDWPVPYPYACIDDPKKCPTREINDVENFLKFILNTPAKTKDDGIDNGSYMQRQRLVLGLNEDAEDGEEAMEYPAVWFPINARNKVHMLKTLFGVYMERAHHYEEPPEPTPLCVFKFDITKLEMIEENYRSFGEAIKKFGIFEFDDPRSKRLVSDPADFKKKRSYQSGNEVIVVVLKRIGENAFLAFAGNSPIFVEEDGKEAANIVKEWFPAGAVDFDPHPMAESEEEEEEEYFDDY